MRISFITALWPLALTRALATPHAGSGLKTVETQNGFVTGYRSPKANDVWEYLGIPYAQPPLGELRFAAPKRYQGNGSYNATNFGFNEVRWAWIFDLTESSDCPQVAPIQPSFPGFTPQAVRILHYFTAASGTQRSEDCLTLNIWSKEITRSSTGDKAVFVLFHGGRFAIGNSNTPFANGQYLASSEDIVVVSVNYRLNVFGFPGAPEADTNLGLRDQRLAVEWVQENISAFGGDPRNIVIAGQSAGSAAVDWWAYAYAENPIAHGLMSSSGTVLSFPLNTPQKQLENWYILSVALGCGSSGNTIPCMREKPWEAISTAAATIAPSPGGSPVRTTPPFYPMVDDELIFADYVSRAETGQFARIPYLHGHNDYEQGYYVIPAFAQGRNITEEQGADFLLETFVCPHSFEARQRITAGVPTWLYRYFGDWDNTRLYNNSGAYHGTDLHMILGGSEDASGICPSSAQQDTVKLFQRAVAAFAKDPHGGLTRFGWPRFDPGTESWIEIATRNEPTVSFSRPEKYDRVCSKIAV